MGGFWNLTSTSYHGNHGLFPTTCFQGCLWRNKDGYSRRSSWHKKNYSATGGFWCSGAENGYRGVLTINTFDYNVVLYLVGLTVFSSCLLLIKWVFLFILSAASWSIELVLCCWKRRFNHRLCCSVSVSWGQIWWSCCNCCIWRMQRKRSGGQVTWYVHCYMDKQNLFSTSYCNHLPNTMPTCSCPLFLTCIRNP